MGARRAAARRPEVGSPAADRDLRRRRAGHPQRGLRARPPTRRSTSCWPTRSATGTSRRPTETLQLRVTKKGAAQLHRAPNIDSQHTGHDRDKPHLIDPGDPLFTVLGAGASKRRQVDAFLRVLAAAVDDAGLPTDRPLCVVDLGCGNAYLTFAAYRYLSERGDVELVGVDLREEARVRNTAIAADLGWSDHVRFEAAGSIVRTRTRTVDAGAGRRTGAACVRHRDRRRAGPGGALGGAPGPRRAVLPPRPAAPAEVARAARALRPAHAAPDPSRALRRRTHRRVSCRAAPPGRLPRRRHPVRGRGVHPAQHDDPGRAPSGRRPTAMHTTSTTRWCEAGGSRPTCRPCSPMPSASVAAALLARGGSPRATGTDVAVPVADPALEESSGLAVSRATHDVLWTHTDGGDVAEVMAVDGRGRTVATVTAARHRPLRPRGARARESTPDGRPALFLGDIGDNRARRPDISVFRFAEPRRAGRPDRRTDVVAASRYPDGPKDAEALLVDPRDGRIWIATKDVSAAASTGPRASCGPIASTRSNASPTCPAWSPTARSCRTGGSCCAPTRSGLPLRRAGPARAQLGAARPTAGRVAGLSTATGCWSAVRAGSQRSTPWRCRAATRVGASASASGSASTPAAETGTAPAPTTVSRGRPWG